MKPMKKLFSLILAALLLFAAALPAFCAELVETAELYYQRPFAGDKVSSLHVESGDPDKYQISVNKIYYFEKDENGKLIVDSNGKYAVVYLNDDDVFAEGIDYYIRFEFIAKSGYQIDESKTTFIINSKVISGSVGTRIREDSFRARPQSEKQSTDSADLCPYCQKEHTGFFDFLTLFFHKILFKLFGAKNK